MKVLPAVLFDDHILFMRRPKGLIYAEESFVKNGRVIGGNNAQYNTWQWQVRSSGYILNCDFN